MKKIILLFLTTKRFSRFLIVEGKKKRGKEKEKKKEEKKGKEKKRKENKIKFNYSLK